MTSPNTGVVYYYYITACRHRYIMYCITMCFFINIYHHIQKSLKIPKGQSESYTSIEEEQTTQWPKEKVQKDKKRSTKYTHKTKNRVIRT